MCLFAENRQKKQTNFREVNTDINVEIEYRRAQKTELEMRWRQRVFVRSQKLPHIRANLEREGDGLFIGAPCFGDINVQFHMGW